MGGGLEGLLPPLGEVPLGRGGLLLRRVSGKPSDAIAPHRPRGGARLGTPRSFRQPGVAPSRSFRQPGVAPSRSLHRRKPTRRPPAPKHVHPARCVRQARPAPPARRSARHGAGRAPGQVRPRPRADVEAVEVVEGHGCGGVPFTRTISQAHRRARSRAQTRTLARTLARTYSQAQHARSARTTARARAHAQNAAAGADGLRRRPHRGPASADENCGGGGGGSSSSSSSGCGGGGGAVS